MSALGRSFVAAGVASAIVLGAAVAVAQPDPLLDGGADAGPAAAAEALRAKVDRALDLDREGKPVEAVRLLSGAVDDVRAAGKGPEVARARLTVLRLLARVAKMRFDVPPNTTDLVVEVDGRPVVSPAEGKSYTIDPGQHQVTARALRGGVPVALDETFSVFPLEVHTVWLGQMAPAAEACICERMPACMDEAHNEEEARRCMATGRIRPGCGGCGTSSGGTQGVGFWAVPLALGWLAHRSRRGHRPARPSPRA